MGYYIKCEHCGQWEKYTHPNCGCLEKRRNMVLQKIVGSKVIVNAIREKGPYVFLYTLYEKDGILFWVRTVIQNPNGEYYIYEMFKEVSPNEVDEVDEVDEVGEVGEVYEDDKTDDHDDDNITFEHRTDD